MPIKRLFTNYSPITPKKYLPVQIPAPFYMVEIFTKEGTDSELMRNWIIEKTQMVPAIYDNIM
jgi:hypothetical protein